MSDQEWTKRMIIILITWCVLFMAWHSLSTHRINQLAERIVAIENKP